VHQPAWLRGTFNSQSCALLACNGIVKGWNGASCERYTASLTVPICKPTGTCATSIATDFAFCTNPVSSAPVTSAGSTCPSLTCAADGASPKCTPGAAGTSHDSIAEVCETDGTSCGTNFVCNAGSCKLDAGQTCAANSDCALNICGGAVGKCCNVPCTGPCYDCGISGLIGQCAGTCNTATGCANGLCPAVVCSNKVKGWSGANARFCEFYTGNTPSGVCSSRSDTSLVPALRGGCAATTNLDYCLGAPTSTAIACADAACKRPGACLEGAAVPTVAAVCLVNREPGMCSGGRVCSATGACLRDFGATCTADSECLTGICTSNGICCASRCKVCETCSAAGNGVCTATCTNPNGCASALCSSTSIPCSGRVAGWVSTNQCHRYSADVPNFCLQSGDCSTAADVDRCDNPPTALSTVLIGSSSRCDTGCVQSTACVVNDVVANADSFSEVCFVSGTRGCGGTSNCNAQGKCVAPGATCMSDADCPPTGNATKCYGPAPTAKVCCLDQPGMTWNHPCQVCVDGIPTFNCPGTATQGCAEPIYSGVAALCTTSIPCMGRARGWNGAACERFAANEPGKCRPGGLCNTATDFVLCNIATVNVAQTCADVRCIDPSRCQLGDTNIATLDDVCLIAGEAGTCPSGSTCNSVGACKKNLGQTCTVGSECFSTFCQQGVCCNVASCAGTGGIGGECPPL
jgi:hypothetical protein